MRWAVLAVCAAALTACADAPSEPAPPDAGVIAAQQDRVERLRERQAERGSALTAVSAQRERATLELQRAQQVRGRDLVPRFELRYGSDGTGDPPGWRQAGPDATRAPTSTPATIARFEAALAQRRIALVGAAKLEEVRRGLIDDRVLTLLITLSARHQLQVNSLRVSHPATVQDELGTPIASNHVYGRAADVSAVDGVPCARESARAPYRTLVDNPPPARHGPCLGLALEASVLLAGTPEEIIFYWRVPGPAGTSLPNHDDHVHLGFRSYPTATDEPVPMWESETLDVPPSTDGDGTSAD